MHGLLWRYIGTFPEHSSSKIWWLGVCDYLSKALGIHFVAVRFFVLLYKLLALGLIFYFIYYWLIIKRVSIPLLTPEHEIQITKIKS